MGEFRNGEFRNGGVPEWGVPEWGSSGMPGCRRPGHGARGRRRGWFLPWNRLPDVGQAAFGNVSLTVLKLSTTTSLSSEPVSRWISAIFPVTATSFSPQDFHASI